MPELNHLTTRDLDRVKRNTDIDEKCKFQILTSSSDLGVVRNGGRRGSNFGPQAILSNLLKMASHQTKNKFAVHEVSSDQFDQEADAKRILPKITKDKKIIHLGGGHDHIFPLLKAINQHYKKITVINIDPHLDTRIDKISHSGTPFRQFADQMTGEFHLIQIGTHDFANPDSNYAPLTKGKMDIVTFDAVKISSENFSKSIMPALDKFLAKKYESNHALVLSLDCDALESGVMEGVSAVNHHGFPLSAIEEIIENLVNIYDAKFFGIYEYNPVYDNLSEKGSRAIANLIYGIIEK